MADGLGSKTTGGQTLLHGPRDKYTQTDRRTDEQTSGQTDKETDKFACIMVNWTVWKRQAFFIHFFGISWLSSIRILIISCLERASHYQLI